MIKRSFNFIFWGTIFAFIAYNISRHFDSFEIANTNIQNEQYEAADAAISKYNKGSHSTLATVNGYILQSEISNQLDRLYLSKEFATHALEVSQKNDNQKAICISQNALQKSKLLIGDFKDVEKPLLLCLNYFKSESNDFDTMKTLNNLMRLYLLTDSRKFISYFSQAEEIVKRKDPLRYLSVDMYINKMFYHIQRQESVLASEAISMAIELHKKHFSRQTTKLAYLEVLRSSTIVGSKNLEALESINKLMDDKDLRFSISMKIHTLLIMSQVYQDLEDYETARTFTLKAFELFGAYPTQETHAVEALLIYRSILGIKNSDTTLANAKENLLKILEGFQLIKK